MCIFRAKAASDEKNCQIDNGMSVATDIEFMV